MRLAGKVCVTEFDAREIHVAHVCKELWLRQGARLRRRSLAKYKEKIGAVIGGRRGAPSSVARITRRPLPEGAAVEAIGLVQELAVRVCRR